MSSSVAEEHPWTPHDCSSARVRDHTLSRSPVEWLKSHTAFTPFRSDRAVTLRSRADLSVRADTNRVNQPPYVALPPPVRWTALQTHTNTDTIILYVWNLCLVSGYKLRVLRISRWMWWIWMEMRFAAVIRRLNLVNFWCLMKSDIFTLLIFTFVSIK